MTIDTDFLELEVMPCVICKATIEHLSIDNYKDKFQVVCAECTTSTSGSYLTKEIAITKWNEMYNYWINK